MELNKQESRIVEKALRQVIRTDPQSRDAQAYRQMLNRIRQDPEAPPAYLDGFRYDTDNCSRI